MTGTAGRNRRRTEKTGNRERLQRLCMILAILAAGVLTAWLGVQRGLLVEERSARAAEELTEQVLRFHVLADSDSKEDQRIKMQVKEQVVGWLGRELKGADSLEETKAFVSGHLEDVRSLAQETVREAGGSDPVTAELTTDDFPEKAYGDVTFPAGRYEALRIRIGSGRGHNWWCCLYPGLCFTDAVHARVNPEDKEELCRLLDGDTYDMITCTADYKIKWFFFGER